jgi:hypothetical protein
MRTNLYILARFHLDDILVILPPNCCQHPVDSSRLPVVGNVHFDNNPLTELSDLL